ncbi:hypothetical protein [uncultured Roseovarius sp.]|uniref:hypothetical protein n=1 Tax=uncultured Roseovarius sp. TaxID=293344 RepID=UPI00261723D8|nr:hypothetical protein [uncultured Roseovarius sp.]
MRNLTKKTGIWRHINRVLSIAALVFALPAAVSAATFNVAAVFGGGQLGIVNFDFTITADFTVDHTDETVGLTVNSLTSPLFPGQDPFGLTQNPIGFTYFSAVDRLIFGGGVVNSLAQSETDFSIVIDDFLTPQFVVTGRDSLASSPFVSGNLNIFATVTKVAAVPLPLGLPLLLSGLAGLAGLVRIRKSKQALA